jgi:Domain of unknown function (DUF4390)
MRLRIASPAPSSLHRSDGRGRLRRWAAWLGLVLLCAVFAAPAGAANDHIECLHAGVEARDDGYYYSGDFELDLKPRVAEALERGLTLYFVVETTLTRSRWYWFDERPVKEASTIRLSYYALTRQYRVASGNLQIGFPTLAEALGVIGHVRDWKIADRNALKAGETYVVETRMRLDTTQLPKPFQINALTNREWVLESEWKRFGFDAPR